MKGEYSLSLSWDIHLLLPLDITARGSWAFDWESHYQLPWSQAFRLGLNDITRSPDSPYAEST